MDLTQLANLGEFIGGVAVLVTLVYLARQVNQGNRLTKTQVLQEASRASTEFSLLVAGHPEHVALMLRAGDDFGGLSREEHYTWFLLMRAGLNYFETLYYANERGEVQPEIWDSRVSRMRRLAIRGLREGWSEHRSNYGASFCEFFENNILAVTPDQANSNT